MPIRFRCAYCRQLMGIAARKAGAVVRCPRCAGEVIVPALEETSAAAGAGGINPFLESDAFAEELGDIQGSPPGLLDLPAPPALYNHAGLDERSSPAAVPSPMHISGETTSHDVRRRGLFLPSTVLVSLAGLLLVVIGFTFMLGFLLGRWSARM